ncbi:hypothetical protein L3Y34_009403 [Caenorhabditis briggsae]|uniref:Uncharacterized protein n=1 Tax=Caenorhabditis briggsae TaxID=6238 RepID=A0AAE9A5N7_CAEBR|nr:hypothetical protein L3Y34_009403 [Caenorhabditis briggsae]
MPGTDHNPEENRLQLADAPEWFIDIANVRVTNVHVPHIRSNEIQGLDQILQSKSDPFDLHWFTTSGAIVFVKDLIWEVTASDTILKSAALEIPLLTGHGSHTDRKVSEIQRMLLIHLDGRIRTPELNLEMLILFFAKKRISMSNRRPFSELNEYSLPDLERRIIIAVLHNELDLAEFLNAVDPLRGEVDHNRDDVDNTMNSNSSDTDSIASDSLELELDEGEQQQREENDREDQEVAEKENKE